jgi:excisionase family DNA binding protein
VADDRVGTDPQHLVGEAVAVEVDRDHEIDPVDGAIGPVDLHQSAGLDREHLELYEPRLGRSVSLDHAARLLHVSRRTIYYRIRAGRLRTIRTLGGSQRVLVDSMFECGFRPQAFPTSAAALSTDPSPRP